MTQDIATVKKEKKKKKRKKKKEKGNWLSKYWHISTCMLQVLS